MDEEEGEGEEVAGVERGASNAESRGTFPENVLRLEAEEAEGEAGVVAEEEMDVSSVVSKVTFQESAPKQVEEGAAEGDEEEGAGADSREDVERPRF